jgi:hypothetical protein
LKEDTGISVQILGNREAGSVVARFADAEAGGEPLEARSESGGALAKTSWAFSDAMLLLSGIEATASLLSRSAQLLG